MTIYDKFTTSTKESLAKWIADFGNNDDSPWMNWFDRTYCQKCESEIVTTDESEAKLGFQLLFVNKTECSYCEVYKECRFFPNRPTPDIEEIIRMWLEQEVEVDSDTPTRLYPQSDTCPICGTYHPDGYVCTECLKKWGMYKPKEEYLY